MCSCHIPQADASCDGIADVFAYHEYVLDRCTKVGCRGTCNATAAAVIHQLITACQSFGALHVLQLPLTVMCIQSHHCQQQAEHYITSFEW